MTDVSHVYITIRNVFFKTLIHRCIVTLRFSCEIGVLKPHVFADELVAVSGKILTLHSLPVCAHLTLTLNFTHVQCGFYEGTEIVYCFLNDFFRFGMFHFSHCLSVFLQSFPRFPKPVIM